MIQSLYRDYSLWRSSFPLKSILVRMEDDESVAMKVIVVGDGQVGKTSLIMRFCRGTFSGVYKRTLGVDFLERKKYVQQAKTEVRFQLWDTAGQEEFRALTRRYYRGAHAALLVFSIVDPLSFDSLHTWRAMVVEECGEIPMAVVQNKCDLERRVALEEVLAQTRHWGLPLFSVSVKEARGVETVFDSLALAVITQPAQGRRRTSSTASTLSSTHKREAAILRRKQVFSLCSLL